MTILNKDLLGNIFALSFSHIFHLNRTANSRPRKIPTDRKLNFTFKESLLTLWSENFTSLVKFIHNYFILFDAIVNGIVFLISLSDNSFLLYRIVTDFCILIWYLATLLILFIKSNSFLVASLGFFISKTMSFSHSDNFASLLIWVPFVSFSCLIALAGTFSTLLNSSANHVFDAEGTLMGPIGPIEAVLMWSPVVFSVKTSASGTCK